MRFWVGGPGVILGRGSGCDFGLVVRVRFWTVCQGVVFWVGGPGVILGWWSGRNFGLVAKVWFGSGLVAPV